MKITFIGGGCPRVVAVAREILRERALIEDGEIALYDVDQVKAQTVGRMIGKTPEKRDVNTNVTWGMSLEEALAGAHFVYIVIRCPLPAQDALNAVWKRHHIMSSDNVSLNGAMIALETAPVILDIARKLETLSPDAWILDFANPVPIYTYLVNRYTSIKTVGLCGGHLNHRWDLPMVLGETPYGPVFDECQTEIAGINHLSWIVRGTYRGRDIFDVLEEKLWDEVKVSRPGASWWQWAGELLVSLYRTFGYFPATSEWDGMVHFFWEEDEKMPAYGGRPDTLTIDECLERDLGDDWWVIPEGTVEVSPSWKGCPHPDVEIGARVIAALSGSGRAKLGVIYPNRGAVADLPQEAPVHCTMWVDDNAITPVACYALPPGTVALTHALVEFQMLVGEAIINDDMSHLRRAFHAYPMLRTYEIAETVFKDVAEATNIKQQRTGQRTRR